MDWFLSTPREADHRIYLPVEASSGPAQIGDVILTRSGESRIGINRVFAAADTVKLTGAQYTCLRVGGHEQRPSVVGSSEEYYRDSHDS